MLRLAEVLIKSVRDERYATIGGALGLIEQTKAKLSSQVHLISQHSFGVAASRTSLISGNSSPVNPIKVQIPPADIFPMAPLPGGIVLNPVTIDGRTVQSRKPQLMKERSDDETAEMLATSVRSVKRAQSMVCYIHIRTCQEY